MDDPILTARLRMRPFEPHDVTEVRAIFSDPEVGEFVGVHDTDEATQELIALNREHQERHGFGMWAVEERAGGTLVGEVGLQLLEHKGPEVEVGWVIARPCWGRGYATEAARAWLEAGFTTLGLEEIVAVIRPENAASHEVARRLGMQRAGTRHVYDHDLDLYVVRAAR